ncbi:flavoprotein [Bacillus inaquosorum]|uniref:flavoprotein n=1 Tax=Bacillus inaquosorum TaxID=483913 RepID=UPI002280DDC2|nr:flavoprotein [Bacillus inaquosorum]MCY7759240.1 Mersacidin decarboxylase [Bacillus inaquosorum]MCY8725145.1 Mersacidin decarboxylase [Bacillus inaquosorum]MCY8733799.1 Mersacidin decarboxylase [Bacillus inaquosorum]MCY8789799.1 Mersacidin decarboxylase [Bacillus inaquosorum]MCY9031940.1 Mersacidin decarboxylase [Bacillus inaquosorum]
MDFSFLKNKKILVGVSGSISSVGISSYLLYFKNYFEEVRVILTKSAEDLIPSSTVSYFCDKVYTDQKDENGKRYSHVEIGGWADLYCILPATANILGQAAQGAAGNLLTTTILAHPHPTLFFPAMNNVMWEKKAVNRNIQQLREDDHIVIDPVEIMAFEVSSGKRKLNRAIIPPDKALIEIAKVIETRIEHQLT